MAWSMNAMTSASRTARRSGPRSTCHTSTSTVACVCQKPGRACRGHRLHTGAEGRRAPRAAHRMRRRVSRRRRRTGVKKSARRAQAPLCFGAAGARREPASESVVRSSGLLRTRMGGRPCMRAGRLGPGRPGVNRSLAQRVGLLHAGGTSHATAGAWSGAAPLARRSARRRAATAGRTVRAAARAGCRPPSPYRRPRRTPRRRLRPGPPARGRLPRCGRRRRRRWVPRPARRPPPAPDETARHRTRARHRAPPRRPPRGLGARRRPPQARAGAPGAPAAAPRRAPWNRAGCPAVRRGPARRPRPHQAAAPVPYRLAAGLHGQGQLTRSQAVL